MKANSDTDFLRIVSCADADLSSRSQAYGWLLVLELGWPGGRWRPSNSCSPGLFLEQMNFVPSSFSGKESWTF